MVELSSEPPWSARVEPPNQPFYCARCREPLGLFEPIWWMLPDGSIQNTGLLYLCEHPQPMLRLSQLFHHGCLTPEHLPE